MNKFAMMLRSLLLIAVVLMAAGNVRAGEPKIETLPFPVGWYDYQDRVVACNLAMNTSFAMDGAERFLSNADFLEQRCGLRGVLAAAEQEACESWRELNVSTNCTEWLNEFRAIRGNANKLKKGRP